MVDIRVHCSVPGVRPGKSLPGGGGCWLYLYSVTAVIAKGKRPVPFRTRKLSPSAPMVLRGGPRGRVGRRRTAITKRVAPRKGRAALFVVCHGIVYADAEGWISWLTIEAHRQGGPRLAALAVPPVAAQAAAVHPVVVFRAPGAPTGPAVLAALADGRLAAARRGPAARAARVGREAHTARRQAEARPAKLGIRRPTAPGTRAVRDRGLAAGGPRQRRGRVIQAVAGTSLSHQTGQVVPAVPVHRSGLATTVELVARTARRRPAGPIHRPHPHPHGVAGARETGRVHLANAALVRATPVRATLPSALGRRNAAVGVIARRVRPAPARARHPAAAARRQEVVPHHPAGAAAATVPRLRSARMAQAQAVPTAVIVLTAVLVRRALTVRSGGNVPTAEAVRSARVVPIAPSVRIVPAVATARRTRTGPGTQIVRRPPSAPSAPSVLRARGLRRLPPTVRTVRTGRPEAGPATSRAREAAAQGPAAHARAPHGATVLGVPAPMAREAAPHVLLPRAAATHAAATRAVRIRAVRIRAVRIRAVPIREATRGVGTRGVAGSDPVVLAVQTSGAVAARALLAPAVADTGTVRLAARRRQAAAGHQEMARPQAGRTGRAEIVVTVPLSGGRRLCACQMRSPLSS